MIIRELCAAVTEGLQGRTAAKEGKDDESPESQQKRSSRAQFKAGDETNANEPDPPTIETSPEVTTSQANATS